MTCIIWLHLSGHIGTNPGGGHSVTSKRESRGWLTMLCGCKVEVQASVPSGPLTLVREEGNDGSLCPPAPPTSFYSTDTRKRWHITSETSFSLTLVQQESQSTDWVHRVGKGDQNQILRPTDTVSVGALNCCPHWVDDEVPDSSLLGLLQPGVGGWGLPFSFSVGSWLEEGRDV